MKPLYWIVLVVIVLALVLGYLGRHQIKALISGSSTPAVQTSTDQNAAAPTASSDAMASPSGMASQEVTVTGSEFMFEPATITVKMNQPVKLTFKNAGKFPHNLTIAGLSVNTKTIQPGEQDTIEFTPDKVGKFEYSCTVDSHASKGMTGSLTVQ